MHTILRTGPVIASGPDDQRYALGDWRSGPPRRWSGHATLTTRNADQIICHGCRAALHIGFARRRRVQRSPQRGTTNGCARQADGPRHRPRRTLASRRCLVGELKAVTLRSGERLAISFLFVFLFLGALPCTDWLADVVAGQERLDPHGTNAGGESCSKPAFGACSQPVASARVEQALRHGGGRRSDGVQLVHARLAVGSRAQRTAAS